MKIWTTKTYFLCIEPVVLLVCEFQTQFKQLFAFKGRPPTDTLKRNTMARRSVKNLNLVSTVDPQPDQVIINNQKNVFI